MKPVKKITHQNPYFRQLLSVVIMMLLLVFLTSINFFLYPSAKKNSGTIAWQSPGNTEKEGSQEIPASPAGPDEKSPDAPVSFNEEYVHESHHEFNTLFAGTLSEHKIHEAEKLCVVHFDLFCPPPLV